MTLKELRESKNLTQSQLAELVGTYPSRISNWESGCGINVKNIMALANALHCSVAEIMDGIKREGINHEQV